MATLRHRSWSARSSLMAVSVGILAAATVVTAPAAWSAGTAAPMVGADSGRCLDVSGASTANGAKVQLWDCHGGSNQQWSYDETTKQVQVYGNKCLDTANDSGANGTAVLIQACASDAGQQWNLASGDTIVSAATGQCLDAASLGVSNGTPVQVWSCNGGGNQRWTGAGSSESDDSVTLTSLEQQALDNVNAQRTANGCGVLTVDPDLQQAAHAYAAEMVETHNFSHTSTTGLSPTDRAKAAGYTRGGVAENIMMGFYGDPWGVVNNGTYGWMSSTGHRANILNCGLTRTGLGYNPGNIDPNYADGSWVQMFG